jgi:hypothetical protein
MKTSKFLLGIGFALCLAIGFGIGVARENARMDTFCGALISGTAAGNESALLKAHESALDAIRGGNVAKAEKVLLSLAHSEAERIVSCEKDKDCLRWSGFEGNRPVDRELVKRAIVEK